MNRSDDTKESGYDLPVYGVAGDTFYYIHVPALFCICLSFCCVITAITLSFRRKSYRTFFSAWSKSERFIVYMAICDGGYNIFHSIDHLHIVIIKDHVRPKELCELYGFTLIEFIMAQNLMVNIVAVNAFLLMYFDKNLEFGSRDWRLLVWTFGLPFVAAAIAGIAGQLGPNGSFCFFDGVKGVTSQLLLTTVPVLIIIVMNMIMYALTWKRIRDKTKALSLNKQRGSSESSHQRAAKTMSMFVVAFVIQWWSLAFSGVWAYVDNDVPQVIHHFVTTFTNVGGVLNLIVYIIMTRRRTSGDTSSTDHGRGTGTVDSSEMGERSTDSDGNQCSYPAGN
ncbi:hypothetical protein ACF0H5_000718 [Mactra antiquata]